MAILIRDHIKLATTSLRHNRTRTFLTALGIAVGVTAIVLIFALAGNVNNLIGNQFNNNASSLVVVRPSTSTSESRTDSLIEDLTTDNKFIKSTLTFEDVDALKKINSLDKIAPISISRTNVEIMEEPSNTVSIVATTPDIKDIVNLPVKTGDFFSEEYQENSAVIGNSAALELFGTENAVAKTFVYNGQRFIVVGVLEENENQLNFNNVNFDSSIIVNIDFTKNFDNPQIQQINLKAKSIDQTHTLATQAEKILSKNKRGAKTFSVLTGEEITHSSSSVITNISLMLTAVAVISLIIGGIGVMNIMLVSVSERTREIGIRKAVGATSQNIMLQFLFESLILSIFGGLLGFILGYIIVAILAMFTPIKLVISLSVVLVVGATTILTGLIFGIYPALKASRKDPITSLKYYR